MVAGGGARIPPGMGRARVAVKSSLRLRYLLPIQEVLLTLAGAAAMLAGTPTVRDPAALIVKTLFCLVLVLFCSAFVVRLDRGHLRLTMLVTQVSAMVLTVPLAVLIG